MRRTIVFLLGVIVLPFVRPAAATMYAAGTGIDGPGCGTKASPCRSISQAVENAPVGDTVIVGPGVYGDLDGDGVFDAGDEAGFPFCGCMLGIDKAVTVLSSAGAAATVIDARQTPALRSVFLIGSGIVFGKPGKGFTVTSSTDTNTVGIYVVGDGIKVSGNQVVGAAGAITAGTGIEVGPGNLGPALIEGNQAIGWFRGIRANGPSAIIRKNVASMNVVGVGEAASATIVGNVVVANFVGIGPYNGLTAGNAALGNVRGIEIGNGGATIEKNDIFGNRECGLLATPFAAVSAMDNYWGAPTGPGPDPADFPCLLTGASVTSTPFATKPFSVKVRVKP